MTLALGALWGCTQRGPAVLAEVDVAAGVRATCFTVEALSPGGEVLAEVRFPAADKPQYRVAVYQGDLPAEVDLRARALWGEGCEAPLFENGEGPATRAVFLAETLSTAKLTVEAPGRDRDADGDGFIATAHGGPDCLDGDVAAHPAAEEDCQSLHDLNCDGHAGCADAACAASACVEPPVSIAFATEPVTVGAGECSPPLILQARDPQGVPAAVAQDTPVQLVPSPAEGVAFFVDPNCAEPFPQLLLPARSNAVGLHFRATRAGALTLQATALGIGTAEQAQTVLAGPPSKLGFATPPRSLTAGVCSEVLTVGLADAHGNPVSPADAVNVPVSPTADVELSAFADAACTLPLESLELTQAVPQGSLFLMGLRTGMFAVTASAEGYETGVQPVLVTPAAASGLTFTTGPQTLAAGTCSTRVGVLAEDAYGNPVPPPMPLTAVLGALPAVGFTAYGDPACTVAITALTLPPSGAEAGFYFRAERAGTLELSAAAVSLSPAEQAAQIAPGAPAKLRFVTAAQTLPALQCSAETAVEVTDAFDNPSPVAAPQALALAATPAMGLTFFSDSGCATAAQSVSVPQGATAAHLHFRADAAGQHTVDVTSTGLTSASQLQTFTPQAASLTFTTAPPAVWAGECSPAISVGMRDANGDPVTVNGATTVTLGASGAAGFTFHSDSNCNAAVTSVTISKNTPATTFHVRGITGGQTIVTASAATFTDAVLAVTVHPAVQRGTCTLGTGTDSVACPLPVPVPDLTGAFLLVSTSSSSPRPERLMARCYLEDTATVRCTRRSTWSGVNVRWQVAYLPRRVTVRHLLASCSSGDGQVTHVGFSPNLGNVNRSFVLLSSDGVGQNLGPDDLATARLTANNNVRIDRAGGNCDNNARYAVQVVEWPDANASRNVTSALTGTSLPVTGLGNVDPARTFLLYGWNTSVNGGNSICGRMVRGRITANNALAFTRGCSVSSGVTAVAWERVQLPPGNLVHSVDLTAAHLVDTVSASLPAVDRSRTLLFSGGQAFGGQGGGEGQSSVDVAGAMLGRLSFEDADTVRVQRGYASNQSTWTVQAVEVLP